MIRIIILPGLAAGAAGFAAGTAGLAAGVAAFAAGLDAIINWFISKVTLKLVYQWDIWNFYGKN